MLLQAAFERSVLQTPRTNGDTRVFGIMKSLFWFLVAVVLKWTQAVPYGFGNVGSVRQVDAIVVEAAPSNPSDSNFQSPSFSPDSSYQSNPVQTPSCRYRVYYDQASKSSSESATGNTRQNVQSNYDTHQDYQPARYNSYQEYQPARYNSNQEYQQVREAVKSQYSSYSPSFRTPSASVESSNYYQQNNNDVQDVTNKVSSFMKDHRKSSRLQYIPVILSLLSLICITFWT